MFRKCGSPFAEFTLFYNIFRWVDCIHHYQLYQEFLYRQNLIFALNVTYRTYLQASLPSVSLLQTLTPISQVTSFLWLAFLFSYVQPSLQITLLATFLPILSVYPNQLIYYNGLSVIYFLYPICVLALCHH